MAININPSLIHGLSLQWVSIKYPEELDSCYKRERIDVRVYEITGSGYYFVSGHGPGKWYYKSDPTENFYTNTTINQIELILKSGGRVQIVGDRGKSFGVWKSWAKFAEEVLQ